MQNTGFLFVTFVLTFCGTLAVLLLVMIQKMCRYHSWSEQVKQRLAVVEDITVEKLEDLLAKMPPYSNVAWCLGDAEYSHIVKLKNMANIFILNDARWLLGYPIVRIQATLPGHSVSIGTMHPRQRVRRSDLYHEALALGMVSHDIERLPPGTVVKVTGSRK